MIRHTRGFIAIFQLCLFAISSPSFGFTQEGHPLADSLAPVKRKTGEIPKNIFEFSPCGKSNPFPEVHSLAEDNRIAVAMTPNTRIDSKPKEDKKEECIPGPRDCCSTVAVDMDKIRAGKYFNGTTYSNGPRFDSNDNPYVIKSEAPFKDSKPFTLNQTFLSAIANNPETLTPSPTDQFKKGEVFCFPVYPEVKVSDPVMREAEYKETAIEHYYSVLKDEAKKGNAELTELLHQIEEDPYFDPKDLKKSVLNHVTLGMGGFSYAFIPHKGGTVIKLRKEHLPLGGIPLTREEELTKTAEAIMRDVTIHKEVEKMSEIYNEVVLKEDLFRVAPITSTLDELHHGIYKQTAVKGIHTLDLQQKIAKGGDVAAQEEGFKNAADAAQKIHQLRDFYVQTHNLMRSFNSGNNFRSLTNSGKEVGADFGVNGSNAIWSKEEHKWVIIDA